MIDYILRGKGNKYVVESWPEITRWYVREICEPIRSEICFEDSIFKTFDDLITYLQKNYGNWQPLIPEEQRKEHGDLITDFEKDYRNYIDYYGLRT